MKHWIFLLMAVWWAQAVPAQKMRDVFAALPDSLLGIMTKNNRLDCID